MNIMNFLVPKKEKQRLEEYKKQLAAYEQQAPPAKREALQSDPFDPRTEVSADAKKIVRHMWIIFVLLPIVCVILIEVIK